MQESEDLQSKNIKTSKIRDRQIKSSKVIRAGAKQTLKIKDPSKVHMVMRRMIITMTMTERLRLRMMLEEEKEAEIEEAITMINAIKGCEEGSKTIINEGGNSTQTPDLAADTRMSTMGRKSMAMRTITHRKGKESLRESQIRRISQVNMTKRAEESSQGPNQIRSIRVMIKELS